MYFSHLDPILSSLAAAGDLSSLLPPPLCCPLMRSWGWRWCCRSAANQCKLPLMPLYSPPWGLRPTMGLAPDGPQHSEQQRTHWVLVVSGAQREHSNSDRRVHAKKFSEIWPLWWGKSDHSFYEFEFCVIHSKLDYVMEVPVREIRLRVLAGREVNLADIVGFEWWCCCLWWCCCWCCCCSCWVRDR